MLPMLPWDFDVQKVGSQSLCCFCSPLPVPVVSTSGLVVTGWCRVKRPHFLCYPRTTGLASIQDRYQIALFFFPGTLPLLLKYSLILLVRDPPTGESISDPLHCFPPRTSRGDFLAFLSMPFNPFQPSPPLWNQEISGPWHSRPAIPATPEASSKWM